MNNSKDKKELIDSTMKLARVAIVLGLIVFAIRSSGTIDIEKNSTSNIFKGVEISEEPTVIDSLTNERVKYIVQITAEGKDDSPKLFSSADHSGLIMVQTQTAIDKSAARIENTKYKYRIKNGKVTYKLATSDATYLIESNRELIDETLSNDIKETHKANLELNINSKLVKEQLEKYF